MHKVNGDAITLPGCNFVVPNGKHFAGWLVDGKDEVTTKVKNSYFAGNVYNASGMVTSFVNSTNASLNNCYILDTAYSQFLIKQGTSKTAEELASGEVAILLNNSLFDARAPWKQNLDNGNTPDASPKLNGGVVYKITDTYYSNIAMYGDLDSSGALDINNYAMVKAHVNGETELSPNLKSIADINGDGTVDGFDAVEISLIGEGYVTVEDITREIHFYDDDWNKLKDFEEVILGATYTLPECTFEIPNGKTFAVWNVNGKTYNPNDKIIIRYVTIIKPIWTKA